ncbi:DNA cytosine methyltransferase [Epilithonimonas xixisoli]|uniref:DNA (Cytosine-5)-methyltransferase 1 n=1 Tax=Epilithonimonas xixisoli TaxID=1476462 RepID=A0A4R8IE79_9FLAO|nr:DNA cytosine methyltransferase [Epilithonimonas xixisoli]TDX83950.1 DNA (cytosine-5)-methyltransferase 1 [Epilithonimonas xixisoli]
MKKYKVLNLYSCLGGNRFEWDESAKEVGIELEVTAVEICPELAKIYQDRFPDDIVIVGDAHQYLLDHYKEFNFIWGSPPCPTHSQMMKATKHDISAYPDMKLYEEILLLKHFFKGKFVIENVKSYYDPLIEPQHINRHYYWANFKIPEIKIKPMKNFSQAKRSEVAEWLGFDYPGKNIYIKGNHDPAQVLRNCIHPLEGKAILDTALGIYNQPKRIIQSLFDEQVFEL